VHTKKLPRREAIQEAGKGQIQEPKRIVTKNHERSIASRKTPSDQKKQKRRREEGEKMKRGSLRVGLCVKVGEGQMCLGRGPLLLGRDGKQEGS